MENKKKLFVGTKNKAKISAVIEVFKDFDIIAMDTESGVKKQPLSEEETITGAKNRALSFDSGYRLGLEAGVTKICENYFLINFGVLVTPDNEIFYGGGTYLPLPKEVGMKLYNSDIELKELMEEYTNIKNINQLGGAISVFTNNLVTRKDIFVHICKLLLGQLEYKEKETNNYD